MNRCHSLFDSTFELTQNSNFFRIRTHLTFEFIQLSNINVLSWFSPKKLIGKKLLHGMYCKLQITRSRVKFQGFEPNSFDLIQQPRFIPQLQASPNSLSDRLQQFPFITNRFELQHTILHRIRPLTLIKAHDKSSKKRRKTHSLLLQRDRAVV